MKNKRKIRRLYGKKAWKKIKKVEFLKKSEFRSGIRVIDEKEEICKHCKKRIEEGELVERLTSYTDQSTKVDVFHRGCFVLQLWDVNDHD